LFSLPRHHRDRQIEIYSDQTDTTGPSSQTRSQQKSGCNCKKSISEIFKASKRGGK
jgi:hypothetical protein